MDVIKDLENKITAALNHFKEELSAIRGSRPTSKLVENISVEYFSQSLPIKQLGSIGIILPREIQISVWDKSVVSNVLKAIEKSNMNISANAEGNMIRIILPPLSEERRQELGKLVKKISEETKIEIRSLRDEAMKKINQGESKGEITEDDKFKSKEEIQKKIDKTNEEIEGLLDGKIKEINE